MTSSTESSGSTPSTAVMAEVQSLRLLVSGLFAAVLVASLGTNLLLYKQMKLLKQANTEASVQFESAVKTFNEGEAKRIGEMINKLKAFAKTNPDYAEVLSKHLPPGQ
jgi:predicted negative regulator of RcsB-dependent stress response